MLSFSKWVGEESVVFKLKAVEVAVICFQDNVGESKFMKKVWKAESFLCIVVDFRHLVRRKCDRRRWKKVRQLKWA